MTEKKWIQDLKIEYVNLTKGEKKVAEYLMDREDEIEHMTLRQCAEGARTGQPTVVRALSRLGFDGWQQFRYEVLKQSGQSSFVPDGNSLEEEKDEGKSAVKRKDVPTHVIRQDIVVLQEMLRGIREREFQEVIQILRKAGSVEIYGAERSAFVAGELEGRLLHMGISCRTYADLFLQKVSAEYLDARSVVIAISQSGTTRMVAEAMRLAKGSGAKMIGILGTRECPIADYCDYVFVTPMISFEGGEKAASRIAQFGFIDLLCEGLVLSDEKRFKENIIKSREKFV